VSEDKARLRRLGRQVEQVLAISRHDACIVHEHRHAQLTGLLHQREHARIGDVELLRVRVDLQRLYTARGYSRQFIQRRLPVVGMDGANGHHFRMLRGQRDQAIVARANLRGISGQCLVRTTKPHCPDAREFDSGRAHLCLELLQRGFAFAQMHVRVEHRLARPGQARQQEGKRERKKAVVFHRGIVANYLRSV
jgi:hypothetical protein